MLSTYCTCTKCRRDRNCYYYFIFYVLPLLADGICNAGGLGYDSLASDESKRWGLTTMVDVYRIELATSARELISGWNLPTMNWLRRQGIYRIAGNFRGG